MELRWNTGHDHRFLLRSYGERALDYARAVMQSSDPAASARVAVEATDTIPDGVTVQAFLLPENRQQPGGIKPFALLSGTPHHPYALTPCSRTDAVYVTAYSRPASAYVGLRLLRIGLTMTPERLDPAEFAKWYTFRVTASPLPNGLRNVRFTWDFGDGSEPVEVLREPRPASDAFSYMHAFTRAENATYRVTFTLWDADAGWELGRATSTVVVDTKPSVRIEPAVASVTEGGQVELAAAGTLLPAAALYTWTFGDGTPGVGPGPAASVQHLYATPGEYTAKVTVAAADRGAVVAENTCRVIVHPKPSDTYPDHVCVPLSGIDYSVLARVEEADTGQTRNVYFLTPGGQRHGRFHKLREDGTTETCGVYIHGRREGTWVDYWGPGVKRRVYHFANDVRDGMDRGWANDGTLAWEQHYIQDQPSGESRLWLFGSWQTTPWPELHGVDGTYETRWPDGVLRERCDFADNRRHGPYILYNNAGDIQQQGTFTHGTKTGGWQYRDAAGDLQPVNHGEGGAR